MKTTTLETIRAKLAEAFPPMRLTPELFNEPTGTWKTYLDVEAFETESNGRSWDMLDSNFVESHHSALIYMKPEAYAAVLPAYLAAFVTDSEAIDHLPFFLLSQLTRKQEWKEDFDARVAYMTTPQRSMILRVLELVAQSRLYPFYETELAAALYSWQRCGLD